MDRPGLEPGKSSAYEAAALTNCANDPYITADYHGINLTDSNITFRICKEFGGVPDCSHKLILSFSPDMKSNPLPWSFTLPASESLSYRFAPPRSELAS